MLCKKYGGEHKSSLSNRELLLQGFVVYMKTLDPAPHFSLDSHFLLYEIMSVAYVSKTEQNI